MFKKFLSYSLLLSCAGFTIAATDSFNVTQTQAIQNIVHQYLVQHPEVLVEAANALSTQQQAQRQTIQNKIVPQLAPGLFADPQSPMIGNPTAPVSVVEFFDYQCPHCKDMGPEIENLLQKNPNLRIIFKALPIFGEESQFAAKAALAAQKQGKFMAFHQALLATQAPLTHDKVLAIAKQVGLNTQQLVTDSESPAIAAEIKANENLAKQLNLTGTPGFVIAKVTLANHQVTMIKNPLFIPGAIPGSVLAEAIAEASRDHT